MISGLIESATSSWQISADTQRSAVGPSKGLAQLSAGLIRLDREWVVEFDHHLFEIVDCFIE